MVKVVTGNEHTVVDIAKRPGGQKIFGVGVKVSMYHGVLSVKIFTLIFNQMAFSDS